MVCGLMPQYHTAYYKTTGMVPIVYPQKLQELKKIRLVQQ